MLYVNLMDEVVRKQYTCQVCGVVFMDVHHSRRKYCKACAVEVNRARWRRCKERQDGSPRAEQHATDDGFRMLAAKIIECAVMDAVTMRGMDRQPVYEDTRSEARAWLRSTGAEWVELMGGDARNVTRVLADNPCMEQAELEGVN